MVTLASGSPSNSLKAPLLLDRHQPFRSSKKFKRQQAQSQNDDNQSMNIEISKHSNLNLNLNLNSNDCSKNMQIDNNKQTITTTFLENQEHQNGGLLMMVNQQQKQSMNLQLLACYEDSSFIYNKTNKHSSPSTSSELTSYCSSNLSSRATSLSSPTSSNSSFDSSSLNIMLTTTTTNDDDDDEIEEEADEVNRFNHLNGDALTSRIGSRSSGHFSSASPSCISAFDYCHLSSSTSHYNKHNHKEQQHKLESFDLMDAKVANNFNYDKSIKNNNKYSNDDYNNYQQQQQHSFDCLPPKSAHQQLEQLYLTSSTTINALDPVYLEDDGVFYNLILKERTELKQRQLARVTTSNGNFECKRKVQQEDNLNVCKLVENENCLVNNNVNNNQNDVDVHDDDDESTLNGQLRHSLLSWMLKVCEHELCQDEIFPLASMILDKFLLFHPTILPINKEELNSSKNNNDNNNNNNDNNREEENYLEHEKEENGNFMIDEEFYCNEDELNQRQLYLFAACSLLLATKLRQTPRLCVQTLIEYSKKELPVELNREEILDGELLILSTLKWDLAALVTPNDFLIVLLGKCKHLLSPNAIITSTTSSYHSSKHSSSSNHFLSATKSNHEQQQQQQQQQETPSSDTKNNDSDNNKNEHNNNLTTNTSVNHRKIGDKSNKLVGDDLSKKNTIRCDEFRVRRHTQTLLELCLMDSKLSQTAPSILAMTSMAVAIDGLSMTEKTCWRLRDIVTQIHESTHKVNELEQMIDVAFKIEKYVQKLLNYTHND